MNQKIIINGRFLSQKTTGVQRYAREIVLALDRQLKNDPLLVELLVPTDADLSSFQLENIKIRKVGCFKGQLWEQLSLPRFAKGSILICLANTAPIWSLWREDAFVTVHDIAWKLFPQSYSRLFKTWYSIIVPFIFKKAKWISTVSKSESLNILKFYPNVESKLKVIHCGGVPASFSQLLQQTSVLKTSGFLLYVGSLNPRKNFLNMLEAARKIQKQYPIRLVIVGVSHASFQSVPIPKENWIEFQTDVNDEGLIQFYRSATALIFPSLYEGFGLPPLEAMACGCPVITSNVSSLPEVCGDAAVYCNPHDPADIAEKTLELIQNENERKKLKALGYAQLKHFSWEKSAEEILNCLKS